MDAVAEQLCGYTELQAFCGADGVVPADGMISLTHSCQYLLLPKWSIDFGEIDMRLSDWHGS